MTTQLAKIIFCVFLAIESRERLDYEEKFQPTRTMLTKDDHRDLGNDKCDYHCPHNSHRKPIINATTTFMTASAIMITTSTGTNVFRVTIYYYPHDSHRKPNRRRSTTLISSK